MYDYFDKNIFSEYHCGFRKCFSTQHAPLVMLEKMKIARDRKGFCAAVLTDLSKAFDCICRDLLIAKLNAYGLKRNALKLAYDYLSNRSQKTKVGSSISTYLHIVYGVPQGSILEPLLFNIDVCDLLFENYSSDFANFADDTTPYECGHSFNEVINNLETTTEKVFEWFSFNNLKANTSKCHLFVSPYEPVSLNVRGSTIESSNCEKLLGIFIDSNFTFEYHINRICRKTRQKLHALSRISKYISGDKKSLLFKSFIISQFSYSPIVWMCHDRGLNNKTNNLHEQALRTVYQDKKSSFETLLKRDKSVSIHIKNLEYLATEIFKVKNDLCPEIMKEIFIFHENPTYNLRSGNQLTRRNIRTTHHGIETISNLGAKIWDLLPEEIKNASSLSVFKTKIKKWIPKKCLCKLCQAYIKNIGFI